jgi:hypothetical protein
MAIDLPNQNIYLPLSHNYAIRFSIGIRNNYNKDIKIYSANPEKIKCKTNEKIKVFRVSHDQIDSITSTINFINNANTKTIYTSKCLDDIEKYLELQDHNRDFYYTPESPVLT